MEAEQYLTEEELVEKMQNGEFGWLDYINHHSAEWQEEFGNYCKEHSLTPTDDSARQFLDYKDGQMEENMDN